MKTNFIIAMGIGMLLTGATPSVAGERLSKETMEKVTEIRSHLKEKRQNTNFLKNEVKTNPLRFEKAPAKQPVFNLAQPTITINCKLVWDKEKHPDLEPDMVVIQSKDWDYTRYAFPDEDEDWTVSVPVPDNKECYVVGLFQEYPIYSVVVNSVVTEDGKEVVIDAEEADQEISFKPILPNGEEVIVDTFSYDDEYNPILEESGTVNEAWYDIQMQMKNSYPIVSALGQYERIIWDGTLYDSRDEVYFKTNANDLIYFSNCVMAASEKIGAIGIKLVADGTNTQTVTNSVDDYIYIERKYADCLWEIPTTDENYPEYDLSKNYGIFVSTNWTFSPATPGECGIYSTDNDRYPTDNFLLNAPSPNGNDYLEMIAHPVKIFYTEIGDYGNSLYGISSPAVMNVNGVPMNLASQYYMLEGYDYGLCYAPDKSQYNYNPWFSFPLSEDSKEIFGDNVPITRFTVGENNDISYLFVGRYSEGRSIDLMNHKVKLSYNGEVIAQSWKELQELRRQWWYDPIDPGQFKLEIEDANLKVNGIQGRNTFITEYDTNMEHFTFPALEILQFRNINDEVTDRFDNTEGTLLTFAAGTLEYDYDDYYNEWYNYEPLEQVKVEYAPNGTDSYKELSVEEDPDKFYMPGYGAYYYATLDQVEGKSENGWFDVRITLVASNGNYQQQTVSPAFKIDNSVGIPTLEEANDNSIIRVAGRNILAPADAMITTASGLISNGINVTPGIYVIHLSNGKTKKVIVK